MIKPILTIQEKCRECRGNPPIPKITMKLGRIENLSKEQRNQVENIGNKKEGIVIYEFVAECRCKGTGTQTAEITLLRDFEKCSPKNHHGWKCSECNCTGYKIPKSYEPYEIKKVSEIIFTEGQYESCQEFWFECK